MKSITGIIFDIDGVLEFQGIVYPRAIEIINTLRARGLILRFLTNSTLKSRASCAAKLQQKGFTLTIDEIVTASYATAMYLRSLNPRSCWVLLAREGLEEFKGLPMDTDNPEYIVIGDYREYFNFESMNKAFRLLRKGAKLVGMIPELVDTSMGELELNVGSWVQMLEKASGVEATYIGKPHPYAIELTLKGMNLPREQVAMIGDRVNTDVIGAHNSGLKSILVKTGEFDPKDLDKKNKSDFVIDTIQDILALV